LELKYSSALIVSHSYFTIGWVVSTSNQLQMRNHVQTLWIIVRKREDDRNLQASLYVGIKVVLNETIVSNRRMSFLSYVRLVLQLEITNREMLMTY
jgi:hypothetical protein